VSRRLAAALLLAIVVSACGRLGNVSRETAPAQEPKQAQEALARWAAAVQAGGGQQAFGLPVPVELAP
jgi:hypothetical protein